MIKNTDYKEQANCPICEKVFSTEEIEKHVNKCIFLNSSLETNEKKRKRSPSPSISPSSSINNNKKCSTFYNKKNDTTFLEEKKECQLNFSIPLSMQMQPKCLKDFIGQQKILKDGLLLRKLLENGEIPNMILWGPPGCGKTSLSAVIHGICKEKSDKLRFVSLCAASCGIKDVQNLISEAKFHKKINRNTILFMDEIHRFNKKQQDIFLSNVENGDIILVGATTENPSFSINSALLSRCRVIVFEKLDSLSLLKILENATKKCAIKIIEKNEKIYEKGIDREALIWLADISDGDARIALNNLQLILQNNNNKLIIKVDDVKEQIKKSHLLYDRNGEEHYNTISAMHKSIRGSDDNAALYWTTRMIISGEDPIYIARRMVRAASEDIGNADPNALSLAISTMQGCQLLGSPECDCLLAQCAIYLARAPKSRQADSALSKAKQIIKECKGPQPSVPIHIRNAPTKLLKELGYGKSQNGYTGFLPKELNNVNFFK